MNVSGKFHQTGCTCHLACKQDRNAIKTAVNVVMKSSYDVFN